MKRSDGFIEADLMVTAFIIVTMIVPVLQLYMASLTMIHRTVAIDRIVQDTITHIERGRADYYHNQPLALGTLPSVGDPMNGDYRYEASLQTITVSPIPVQLYEVKAYYKDDYCYELGTYVFEKNEVLET